MIKNKASEREEIEALLPWHAAGTLSRREARMVEQALAADADLATQYETVREDLVETIVANESLGAPSARAMQKLMADIEADASTARRARSSFNLGEWLSDKAFLVLAAHAGLVGDRRGARDRAAGRPARRDVRERAPGRTLPDRLGADRPDDQARHLCADPLRPAGDDGRVTKLLRDLQDRDRRRPERRRCLHGSPRDDRHAEGRARAHRSSSCRTRSVVRFVGPKPAE